MAPGFEGKTRKSPGSSSLPSGDVVRKIDATIKAAEPISTLRNRQDHPNDAVTKAVAIYRLCMARHLQLRLTDGAGGGGVPTVKALTIGGAAKPAGTCSAATEKWFEGKGKVIVRP